MPGILKISEAASLALHAMIFLMNGQTKNRSTKEIAAALQGSESHLSKVLQRLSRAGILDSMRGPRGGFSVSKKGRDATLMEIYEAIEGPFEVGHCVAGSPICGKKKCVLLGGLTDSISRQLRDRLTGTRVRDLGGGDLLDLPSKS
jgi:Rrf2 family protein